MTPQTYGRGIAAQTICSAPGGRNNCSTSGQPSVLRQTAGEADYFCAELDCGKLTVKGNEGEILRRLWHSNGGRGSGCAAARAGRGADRNREEARGVCTVL